MTGYFSVKKFVLAKALLAFWSGRGASAMFFLERIPLSSVDRTLLYLMNYFVLLFWVLIGHPISEEFFNSIFKLIHCLISLKCELWYCSYPKLACPRFNAFASETKEMNVNCPVGHHFVAQLSSNPIGLWLQLFTSCTQWFYLLWCNIGCMYTKISTKQNLCGPPLHSQDHEFS